MATFKVTDPQSGKTVTLRSEDNTPPSEQELEQVFSGLSGDMSSTVADGQFDLPDRPMSEPDEPSALNPIERGLVSLPRTPDAKMEAIRRLGFQDVQLTPEQKILVNGKTYDPSPQGIVSFLRDLPGDIGDMFGPGLPIAGQIGADIATVAAAAPTGGASLPLLAASGAAGAAAGEGVRQTLAHQVSGEQPSLGHLAGETALGAAGPFVGAGIGAVGSKALKGISGPMNFIAKKLGDSTPSLMESIGQIPKGETLNLMNQLKAGKAAGDILNDKVADPNLPGNLFRRTFFGHTGVDESEDNLIRQFQNLYFKADPVNRASVKEFYKTTFGLSDESLDQMVNHGTQLLSKTLQASDSGRYLAQELMDTITKAESALDERYGTILRASLTGPKAKSTIDLKKGINEMISNLEANNPGGLGILSSGEFSETYTGKEAIKLYREVLERFKQSSGFNAKTNPGLAKLLKENPEFAKGIEGVNFDAVGKYMERMSASEVFGILRDLKPLLSRAYKVLDDEQARPLSVFLSSIRSQLDTISPELAKMKERFGNFEQLKSILKPMEAGNAQAALTAESIMKQIYAGERAGSYQSVVADLDNFVPKGNKKLLSRIKEWGAAKEIAELKKTDYITKAKSNFVRSLSKLNKPDEALNETILSRYDSAIKQKFYKFLQEAKNHETAKAYQSRPQNFFRARALVYLLGGGGLFAFNPAVGAAAMAGGIASLNPANLGRAITAGQSVGQSMGRASQKVGKVGKSQRGSRALLALLMRQGGNEQDQ